MLCPPPRVTQGIYLYGRLGGGKHCPNNPLTARQYRVHRHKAIKVILHPVSTLCQTYQILTRVYHRDVFVQWPD
jgi:hypothetical protein